MRPLAHPLHTLLLVALILLNSWYGGVKTAHPQHAGTLGYIMTACLEIAMIGFIWLGLRLRGTPFREVIGRRWKSLDDFMLDIGIAMVLWLAMLCVVGILQYALGMVSKQGLSDKLGKLQPLAPQSVKELMFFLVLAIMAGIAEEIVFRGYLQKQFAAWFRNVPAGIIVSALLFGAAHGYQGLKLMLVIAAMGAVFGIVAARRRSVIPGMIAHGWQDSVSGFLLWLYNRYPQYFKLG